MTLTLILAIIFTACLAIEAFSNDGVALRVARIGKFVCGAVWCVVALA